MKVSLYLSIFPNLITAWPTRSFRRSASTEIEQRAANWNVANGDYGPRGNTVEHDGVFKSTHQSASHVSKQISPACLGACGTVNSTDCFFGLDQVEDLAGADPEGDVCVGPGGIKFFGKGRAAKLGLVLPRTRRLPSVSQI